MWSGVAGENGFRAALVARRQAEDVALKLVRIISRTRAR
jgi:hypothetical protein